jgi:hypothetical protein
MVDKPPHPRGWLFHRESETKDILIQHIKTLESRHVDVNENAQIMMNFIYL